jgi:hypothetical protein
MLRTFALFMVVAMVSFGAAAADLDGDGRNDMTLEVIGQSVRDPGGITDDVIHQIPTPPGCQTIVWVCEGEQNLGTLFVCDLWDYLIFELDPATGTILNSFPAVGAGAHGLAWDGRYLIQNEYGAYTAHFTDKNTGMLYYSQPSSGGYGLTWGKWWHPWDDQWLWAADYWGVMMHQDNYYTGGSVFSFPVNGGIGAAWDGSHIWDSNWTSSTVNRYDPNTGALLNTMAAPYTNPRDICWDGHYLWTIHWESQTAYQIDLWLNEGLYPVTQYLNPRYVLTHRNEYFEINATIKNHTDQFLWRDVWLEAQMIGGPAHVIVAGPVHIPLPPGAYRNVYRALHVPHMAPYALYDLYIRCGEQYPVWDQQDGIVVEVAP